VPGGHPVPQRVHPRQQGPSGQLTGSRKKRAIHTLAAAAAASSRTRRNILQLKYLWFNKTTSRKIENPNCRRNQHCRKMPRIHQKIVREKKKGIGSYYKQPDKMDNFTGPPTHLKPDSFGVTTLLCNSF
jgi:hypothetical protein